VCPPPPPPPPSAQLLKPLKQPAVVAEMIAGILLGPTVLGRWDAFTAAVFPPASLPIISATSSFGLVCFMNLVGLELDSSVLANDFTAAAVISLAGTIIPFGFAAFLAGEAVAAAPVCPKRLNYIPPPSRAQCRSTRPPTRRAATWTCSCSWASQLACEVAAVWAWGHLADRRS
jgi:hypothetical protein